MSDDRPQKPRRRKGGPRPAPQPGPGWTFLGRWRWLPLALWPVLRRLFRRVVGGDLLNHAAELAYYFLFALFPLLLALTSLLGYLTLLSEELRLSLFSYIGEVSPSPQVTELLRRTVQEITDQRGGIKLSLGLVGALWVVSAAVVALGRAVNRALDRTDPRGPGRRHLSALLLTVVGPLLTTFSLLLVISGGILGAILAGLLDQGNAFAALWNGLQRPVALLFLWLAFDLLYNYSAGLPKTLRAWFTPGAALAVALWVAASHGFRLYLESFGAYSRIYGSLGVVIVLLSWLYLGGVAVLLGIEVNAELASRSGAG
jgi:membrane protein